MAMKPSELYDIVLPQSPEFDWMGELWLAGEILLVVGLIGLLWKLLPYLLRPLAFRYQLKQLIKSPDVGQFYQWFCQAQQCDVWSSEQHKKDLKALLNQACFSHTSIQPDTLNQALSDVAVVFTLKNIAISLKNRGLNWGEACYQFGVQQLKMWWSK